jgi:hypothetical protein
METLLCDVADCESAAAWTRIAGLNAAQPEFLCHRCWVNLRAIDSEEAGCYAPYEDLIAVEKETPRFGFGPARFQGRTSR